VVDECSTRRLSRAVVALLISNAALRMEHSMQAKDSSVEVRWMTTDRSVCVLNKARPVYVADVRNMVRAISGVSNEHQRLIVEGEELPEHASTLPEDVSVIKLVRSLTDARVTNITALHPSSMNFPELPAGDFRKVRKLADGINGKVYQYRYDHDDIGEDVAVKVIRTRNLHLIREAEPDERTAHLNPRPGRPTQAEDSLTEIGVLKLLAQQETSCRYILNLVDVFTAGDHTWLVTEFAEGGELFNVAALQSELAEHRIKVYLRQTLEAVEHIHRLHIGHRDISLENILLKNGEVRLMDFGIACRTHTSAGTPLRYYRTVGKDYYRPPEMHVPRDAQVAVRAPEDARPGEVQLVRTEDNYVCEVRYPEDVVQGAVCMAEPWGYAVPPADIYSTAICLFILAYGCQPWQRAMLSDRTFAWVYAHSPRGLERLIQSWRRRQTELSSEAIQLLLDMTSRNPTDRPSAAECLQYPWFT